MFARGKEEKRDGRKGRKEDLRKERGKGGE